MNRAATTQTNDKPPPIFRQIMPSPQSNPSASPTKNPMQILLFADLDDTLFTSGRKAPPGDTHIPVAWRRDGSPVSYTSPVQQTLLAHWQAHARIIPTTARNHDAYRRAALPFADHAIINHGGIILSPDGTPDRDWLARSRRLAATSRDTLAALAARVADPTLNTRLISDHDIPFYLLVKSPGGDLAALARAAARLRPHLGEHCRLLQNGNNLAVLPAWLDKAHAVAHLQQHYRAQYGAILSIGMGDSTSDLPFMRHCDYLLTPAESQIAQRWDDATAP